MSVIDMPVLMRQDATKRLRGEGINHTGTDECTMRPSRVDGNRYKAVGIHHRNIHQLPGRWRFLAAIPMTTLLGFSICLCRRRPTTITLASLLYHPYFKQRSPDFRPALRVINQPLAAKHQNITANISQQKYHHACKQAFYDLAFNSHAPKNLVSKHQRSADRKQHQQQA